MLNKNLKTKKKVFTIVCMFILFSSQIIYNDYVINNLCLTTIDRIKASGYLQQGGHGQRGKQGSGTALRRDQAAIGE